MPRAPRHALSWRPVEGDYELVTAGRVERHFAAGDGSAWEGWLADAPSFTFHGARGSLHARKEARARGGDYWYVYAGAAAGRVGKRYLGPTTRVSLAALEDAAAALASAPEPVPTAPQPTTEVLPATKLAPPRPPATLVGRERLTAALDASRDTPLTLLVAPAGWGKTTALAAWAAHHPAQIAWLSLEEADDNPPRFWFAAIAALRARLPGIGAGALAMLGAPQPPPLAAVITALVNELAARATTGAPLALVLDDFHLIASPAIAESVATLVAHLPPGLRLVLGTRSDPDLPLARLRARGQLAEIRAADLGFTAEEIGAYLHRALGAPLAPDEVAALAARTAGWAAGVQLAALALGHYDDRDAWLAGFTGSHRYLLDYVEEEILTWQPPAIQQFLLQSAVLTRLGAAVCAAVTGEAASAAVLTTLERANLFLLPLDEGRRWYRLHELFREALLARAAREPGLIAEAHRRASRWHAGFGDAREAIAHAQAAGDHAFAAELIAREAPRLWSNGEARTVHDWLAALPDVVLVRYANLALEGARRLLESLHLVANTVYTDARLGVEQTLSRIEEGLRPPGVAAIPDAEIVAIRRRLRLLRSWNESRILLTRLDTVGLAALEAEIAELSVCEEVRWKSIWFGLYFWLNYSLRREGPSLIPQLLAFKAEARGGGEDQVALRVSLWLGITYAAAGRLRLAEREGLEGLALAELRGLQVASVGYLHLNLTGIYYVRNQLDAAAAASRAVLSIARVWQQIDLLLLALRDQAWLALAMGELAAAEEAFREAELIIGREQAVYQAPEVEAARVGYWLVTGDLTSAERWAARTAFEPQSWTPPRAILFVARLRVYLAQRQHAEALEMMDQFAARFDRPSDILATTEYLTLRLIALHGAGRRSDARAVAARLLALIAPEDVVRFYLDAGPPMEEALAALLADDGERPADGAELPHAAIRRLLAAFDDERQSGRSRDFSAAHRVDEVQAPNSTDARSTRVEALTARELDVLRLLATGASNGAIAEALSISPFTVKRHVGNLLGKLGATSRTGAVARARDLGLL